MRRGPLDGQEGVVDDGQAVVEVRAHETSSGAPQYSRSGARPRGGISKRAGALLLALLGAFACARTQEAGDTAPPAGTPAASVAAEPAPDPSSGCAGAARQALIEASVTLEIDGEARRYLIDAPPSTAGDPRPLVLAFHGLGDSAAGFRRGLGLYRLAASNGVIVVHAHGHEGVEILDMVGRGWDLVPTGGRDRPFVDAILDHVERSRCVDRRRVYATGFSNGGFFSNLLACTLGDRLAAVAAIGGAAALPDCTPPRPIPILLLHGSADRIIDPAMVRRARTWWAERNRCGGAVTEHGCVHFEGCAADVVHCEGPQGHRWPSGGLETVWRFLRTHPRRDGPA